GPVADHQDPQHVPAEIQIRRPALVVPLAAVSGEVAQGYQLVHGGLRPAGASGHCVEPFLHLGCPLLHKILGADGAHDDTEGPAPALDLSAVGVAAGAGVALDGNNAAVRHALHNAAVVGGCAAREVVDHHVPGAVIIRHPLAAHLGGPHESPAGGGAL